MLKPTPLSPDFLPATHLPGRSRTLSAWSAFLALIFFVMVGIFYPFFLRGSVRLLLWASQPLTGLTITSQDLIVSFGKPLLWKNVSLTAGRFPHQSHAEFQSFSVEITSPWRMLFGDHRIINALEASNGAALIDLSCQESSRASSFFQKMRSTVHSFLQEQAIHIPPSVDVKNIAFSLITENQRDSIEKLSFSLSQKNPGKLSYDTMLIEGASLHCELGAASCSTTWNGHAVTLANLSLAKEIQIRSLQITPHADRIEIGLISTLFHGLLRADGSIKKENAFSNIEGAVLAQNIPMERLSKFLGLTKKICGNLREGRLIFRGSPVHYTDAEASLRILADNFRYGKKEWASLAMTANIINHKISVSDFQLRQEENHVVAAGEITLPQEWRKIGEAPFHCKLKATIADASQLGDLAGPPWNDITGQLFIEGDIEGVAHRADGYLKVQGSQLALQGLSIDTLKLNLLFQDDTTTLTSCDLSQGSSHLEFSGGFDNSWPHHYKATASLEGSYFLESIFKVAAADERQGASGTQRRSVHDVLDGANTGVTQPCAAAVDCENRFLKMSRFLNITAIQNIHGGNLTARWNGQGSATTHEGSFNISFQDLLQGSHEMSGRCVGSYTQEGLIVPTFLLQSGNKKLKAKFHFFPQGIEATNICLMERNESPLSGNLFLPIDPKALWNHDSRNSTPTLATSFPFYVTVDYFLLMKKMLQGEPIVLTLPENVGEASLFVKKTVSPVFLTLLTTPWSNPLQQADHTSNSSLKTIDYFSWK